MRRLLDDVRALEHMIRTGMIESGVRRIGAEQELFLVDREFRAAPKVMEVLEQIDDDRFTTELARFNIECNLDPIEFGGDCLSQMAKQLNELLTKGQAAARKCGAEILMAGILPTLRKSDLGADNLTPLPRYHALNESLNRLRGGAYEFRFTGTDELIIKHDTVMLEACNNSFQVHFQVGAEEFARLYNIAQIVTGPVLAAAVNSPLLFGRRLWHETRIALFQQAVDTRDAGLHLQERTARVNFGNRWVKESPVELFQEDVSRFRVLMSGDLGDDPFETLEAGGVPKLKALQLHNGTVYRWNRACYGITNGVPHLRIENRVLPAGPTVADEVANAAFWFGLMAAFSRSKDDLTKQIEFDDAKTNFMAAASRGLSAQLTWFKGKMIPASDLILNELLPLAREGLRARKIKQEDVDLYLGIIEERVATGKTGARWMLDSLSAMKCRGTIGERLSSLTAATMRRQRKGNPVHKWSRARLEEIGGWQRLYTRVEQYMTTDVFTVHEDELIDLVANLMDWEHIRHVPVEDNNNEMVGLVSYRSLLRLLGRDLHRKDSRLVPVCDVMHRDPITITPETTTQDAIELMREKRVSCLPVVKDRQLVGIVTEHDFMNIARQLLEELLKEPSESNPS
jgi:CBS domain-containing protein/gamma-glutamyl:cysteine ligase YbdK (ATP-grasp superfamily)